METAAANTSSVRYSRRNAIAQDSWLTGLDYVEAEPDRASRERFLLRMFFIPSAAGVDKDPIPPGVNAERIRLVSHLVSLVVDRIERAPGSENQLCVTVFRPADALGFPGDLPFEVELIDIPALDIAFRSASFLLPADRRKEQHAAASDCAASPSVKPPAADPGVIDYLAKDYETFRGEIIDRMSGWAPGWKERNPSDIGIALIEILAYAGDYLSYYQDAIGTEAYLSTARQRTSVRRHARLLDYTLHDGCNSRTWIQVRIAGASVRIPRGTRFLSSPFEYAVIAPDSADLKKIDDGDPVCFEAMETTELFHELNEMAIYTWGAASFTLPKGATRATLTGGFDNLAAGAVLVFEQTTDPDSGKVAPVSSRHAVRLRSRPLVGYDPLFKVPITEIEWHDEDSLAFALIVCQEGVSQEGASGALAAQGGSSPPRALAMASGNMVLADYGRWGLSFEPPATPESGPYTPLVPFSLPTCSEPLPVYHSRQGAASLLRQDPALALPNVRVLQQSGSPALPFVAWRPRRDLLSSSPFANDFVMENNGSHGIHLRFGDGKFGQRPPAGSQMTVEWRIGNGPSTNIAADTINSIVTCDVNILSVRNPLPATGGMSPMAVRQARLLAPWHFQTQRRCVTGEDYRTQLCEYTSVINSTLRRLSTGLGPVDMVHVQRADNAALDAEFLADLYHYLEPRRIVGRRIDLRSPLYAGLDVVIAVQAVSQRDVLTIRNSVNTLFSRTGIISAANYTFGDPVYLSTLLAAVSEIPGVGAANALRFRVWGEPERDGLASGRIDIFPEEIARLDNDSAKPWHGVVSFDITSLPVRRASGEKARL